jgi:hypothetical protein
VRSLSASWQWIQFLPLVLFQMLAIGLCCRLTRETRTPS